LDIQIKKDTLPENDELSRMSPLVLRAEYGSLAVFALILCVLPITSIAMAVRHMHNPAVRYLW